MSVNITNIFEIGGYFDYIRFIIATTVSLGIYNVWIIRFNMDTKWRGGGAKNITDEFRAFGLPIWFMALIGLIKISLATFILIALWYPFLLSYTAIAMTVMMGGAVSMHLRLKDPLYKLLPAVVMFLLSIILIFI